MPHADNRKYLENPTKSIEVKKRKLSELTSAMKDTAFQGRKLGEAVEAWAEMLREKEVTILMGLSGAMVPAGMGKIIAFLIRNKMIDCLVSTGANIFHDVHEALGGKHYKGSLAVSDEVLLKHRIDRMYDVYASEREFRKADHLISNFVKTLEPQREYSSREFLSLLGAKISKQGDKNSITVSAYECGVPIFVPAMNDSSIGIGIAIARRGGHKLIIDSMKDVDELTRIVEQAKKTGVIYVGGGVPKNFIQQTEVISSILGLELGGHDYAIQFTTDSPQWGGLSGSTFEESVSWGKIAPVAKKVQVFVDATIALPIVVHALLEKSGDFKKRRRHTFLF